MPGIHIVPIAPATLILAAGIVDFVAKGVVGVGGGGAEYVVGITGICRSIPSHPSYDKIVQHFSVGRIHTPRIGRLTYSLPLGFVYIGGIYCIGIAVSDA